ncbi:nitroreductase [Epidermidibacterium keratini]|uniref:Nitroreductase n=1 Tax=Epidermidibacterium keratini TaxID=1891644 RepID=A0A7L4YL85_9ACTN|nr:nitroreductase family protein [Epidermidibacterium keratini]QHB99945.1 nitroreductase [Epidermidibacterium keratini]
MTDAPFDLSQTDKLLTTTRAVRKRLDLERPVDIQVILDCIDLAQQAPTGGNRQRWRWIVITDPDKRREIAQTYIDGGSEYLAGAGASDTPDAEQTARVRQSSRFLPEILAQVPALVIPCSLGRPEKLPIAGQASFYGSIIPAIWSFNLALRSRGLGTVYTTLHLNEEKRAAQILGIPDDATQLALLPVAYTKGTDFKAVERPPVTDIVGINGWPA